MNTYTINIVAPILRYRDKMVAYNEYPIICVTKKTTDELLTTNTHLQDAIKKTIGLIGMEMLDDIKLNIRTITSDRKVSNISIPIKKYYEQWM